MSARKLMLSPPIQEVADLGLLSELEAQTVEYLLESLDENPDQYIPFDRVPNFIPANNRLAMYEMLTDPTIH